MITTLVSLLALAAPIPGQAAPTFTEVSAQNGEISLEQFEGKTVVLEWTNDGCPFVKKHYNANNMQQLQKRAAAEEIVWIQVISSAPGKQGHADAARATHLNEDRGAKPAYVLLDEDGSMGRAYAAKTTPHMFVIDGEGMVRYNGAIDTIPSSNPDDIPNAQNYVSAALSQMKDGGEVVTKVSKPYGCSVKYADS
ncbi:redoxin domain-containing protein [Parvularcula sp. ZS-1/3]|uniref:Redoxin domain-containing protein n=1 Tax=Parvularcula mediterranea TaxID=2732508 RepID=A0A7Y3W5R9_9PROT|nr:redoxin domain-containing protein [Parvularcula mediterranea]NNU16914.1 redoxin domain-containing protein [Parvularcula mediterranea]